MLHDLLDAAVPEALSPGPVFTHFTVCVVLAAVSGRSLGLADTGSVPARLFHCPHGDEPESLRWVSKDEPQQIPPAGPSV